MSDYPKTLYRAGTGIGHMLGDKPLKVDNKHLCDLMRVEDEAGELAAIDDGWRDTAAEACAKVESAAEPPVPAKPDKPELKEKVA